MAKNLGMDFLLLQVVMQNCLKPYLHVWREGLAVTDISKWKKGKCPFCGNWPALAELQGTQRARHLRCGLCGADWLYNRLQCVYCGTTDIKSLGLIQVGEEPLSLSIQTCEACHGFVKTVVALEGAHPDLLPVEDLETLSLDLIASEKGYQGITQFFHPVSSWKRGFVLLNSLAYCLPTCSVRPDYLGWPGNRASILIAVRYGQARSSMHPNWPVLFDKPQFWRIFPGVSF